MIIRDEFNELAVAKHTSPAFGENFSVESKGKMIPATEMIACGVQHKKNRNPDCKLMVTSDFGLYTTDMKNDGAAFCVSYDENGDIREFLDPPTEVNRYRAWLVYFANEDGTYSKGPFGKELKEGGTDIGWSAISKPDGKTVSYQIIADHATMQVYKITHAPSNALLSPKVETQSQVDVTEPATS